jgi:hypothetical protein
MTADEMEIINPETGKNKGFVDSENVVHEAHECEFHGDHRNGLDVNDKCVICGKTLGDFIAEDTDLTRVRIPIIIDPEEDDNHEQQSK